MKTSSARGARPAISRQTAWGCLTTNLTMPGFGSLLAGRPAGYWQAALGIAGVVLTTGFGIRFMIWYFTVGKQMSASEEDPFAALGLVWKEARGPLLGIAVFGIGWLWALATSLSLLHQAKQADAAIGEGAPPRLGETPRPPGRPQDKP